jgi:AhpD family alkylhydroperoxidase
MKPAEKEPRTIREFKKRFPDLWEAYVWYRDASDHQGPLDLKTRELIKVGVSAALGREGGLVAHITRARKSGASEEEILQAILISGPLAGMPGALAAFRMIKKRSRGFGVG